jgi:hypothetical protein
LKICGKKGGDEKMEEVERGEGGIINGRREKSVGSEGHMRG